MMVANRNMYDRLYDYMEHTKLINAQQAKSVHWYNNTKQKLLQTDAIWSNKLCTDGHLLVCFISTISYRIDYF
jgi:hypothetical protein